MPNWAETTLGSVFKVKHGFAFKGEFFTDEPQKYALVTPGNFAIGGGFQNQKQKYYNGPIPKEYVLNPGAVVVTMTDLSKQSDTLGFAALVPDNGTTWLHNQRVGLLEFRSPEKVDPVFFCYLMRTRAYRAWVVGSATGTTVKHTAPSRIESFRCLIPSVWEQRHIASVLKSLDDKIDLNRRINRTLEAMAQAIFKSWFVDFDPVKAKIVAKKEGRDPLHAAMSAISGKTDAELDALSPNQKAHLAATAALFPDALVRLPSGEAPEGWSMQPFAQLTDKIGSGATPRGGKEVYLDEGIALIRSQNVYDSLFVWDGLARIADEAADQLKGVTVQEGDVLLNITGASILRTCVVVPDVLPARVNQHVAIIRGKVGVPPRFLHQHLLLADTKRFLLGLNAGASREAITKGHIESLEILVPAPELLTSFQTFTDPIFLQVECGARQMRALAEMRDTLLPKLLSGELPVNLAAAAVERFGAN